MTIPVVNQTAAGTTVSFTLADASTISASSVSPITTLGPNRFYARLRLDVTELVTTGAPFTLSVKIETAAAGTPASSSAAWQPIEHIYDVSEPDARFIAAIGCKELLRARWEVTGAGHATVTLTGTSYLTLASLWDIEKTGIPDKALSALPEKTRADAVLAASDEALSYLGASFDMPLKSWGEALRMHVANMAVYHAMRRRGYDTSADSLIRQGYEDAIAWLKAGARDDPSIVDSTPAVAPANAYMTSLPRRGWQTYRS